MLFVIFAIAVNAKTLETGEEKIDAKPNLYAVIVGIGKANKLNLEYAVSDTLLFGRTLERNSKSLFSKINIIYLNEGDQTTKKHILEKLNNLQAISKSDLFVFYATSFAKIINENYYMITSNTKSMNDEEVLKSALSQDDLIDVFEKIPAKNKLLLFDTCYPGIAIDLRNKSKDKSNIATISASNSKQTALKIHINAHSVFVNVVTDAIAGEADVDGDGVVKSSELIDYVFNVASLETAKYDYKQIPAFYQAGESFSITSSKVFKPTIVATAKTKSPKESLVEPRTVEPLYEIVKHEAIEISIGKLNFLIDDESIFIDVKRKIKKHFNFTNDKGENLIVFEFYTNRFMEHFVKEVDADSVSQIKIGYHGDSFRVVIYLKTKTSYEYEVSTDGLFIKLVNKKQ